MSEVNLPDDWLERIISSVQAEVASWPEQFRDSAQHADPPAEPSERDWRDIATAPKDGTRILAAPHTAVGSPGWFIAHWGSGHFGGLGGMPGQFREGWLDGPFFAGPQPTHWMPLPKPPQEPTDAR